MDREAGGAGATAALTPYDHFALRAHLQSLGISLRSATEPIDDTSTGKLMEGVLAGILHELLKAIQTAHRAGLLQKREFLFCLDNIGDQGKADWLALVDAATASEQKDAFRKWLVRVRNSVVSHYYQPRDLHNGYRAYFCEGRKGRTTNGPLRHSVPHWSSFYFADAAVGAAYDDVVDPGDTSMAVVRQHMPRVNSTLRGLVSRYIEARHIVEPGKPAATDPV